MPRYYHYLQDRRWLKMSSQNAFSLYRQTSPNFSDISTPSSPPSSPQMASLDQQLQEALAAINGLTEKVQSLTSNLDVLRNENQTLRGQHPASAHSPYISQPTYPSMFSPPATFTTTTFGLPPITNPTTSLTNSCSYPIHPTGLIFQRPKNRCTNAIFRQKGRYGNFHLLLHLVHKWMPFRIRYQTKQGYLDTLTHANWIGPRLARIRHGPDFQKDFMVSHCRRAVAGDSMSIQRHG